jgi:putative phage-type endonuclease
MATTLGGTTRQIGLLDAEEVREMTGLGRNKVYEILRRCGIRVGRRLLIEPEALQAWIAEHRAQEDDAQLEDSEEAAEGSAPAPDPEMEWHAWRAQGIGASDAAAVCGLDRWRSPFVVWLEKTGQLPPSLRRDNEALHWGSLLEPIIIDEFERRTGLVVIARQSRHVHPEHDWMRATVDALVAESRADEEPLGVLEVKTTNGIDGSWREGPPIYYQLQVQHQLACTGLEHAWIAVLIGGQRLEVHEVVRDDEAIAHLIEIEGEFWRQYVLGGMPPPVDDSSATHEALKRAYAEPAPGKVVELDARALALVQERQEAAEAERVARQRREAAESELMALLADAELGRFGEKVIVSWKRVESTRFDLDAFRASFPKTVERFTRSYGYRRLSFPREVD